MTEAIGSAAGGHPDLHLNAEEQRAYGELLKEADPDGFGAVSGDVAVKFFERTKLPPDVLGQIWQIADTENRGFLTPAGFGVVLRLIGHAQAGRVPSASIAAQAAPLPRFDSNARQAPPAVTPLAAQVSGTPSSPTTGGSGPIRVPALSPEKVSEYSSLFEKSGSQNGALAGDVAKQIFERARLPNEVLGRIWFLADTQGRGTLDVTEFIIAMHLLASYKSGAMRGVPNILPPGLYDAASRRPPPRMAAASPRPGSSNAFAPAIAQQFSGPTGRAQSPVVAQFPRQTATPLSAQSTGEPWLITAAEKQKFDDVFNSVDRQGLGYLTGEQAVTFFNNARLSEETLAQIWDLADINSEGRLNRDEFAVAMYLIRQQRSTRDGRGILPPTLPQALIPPSMRKQVIPPSQPTAPAFETAPATQPRSAADDLFGLDVLSPSQPTARSSIPQPNVAQTSQQPSVMEAGPFGSSASPAMSPTTGPASNARFAPFMPSSDFGRSIIPQSTGSPAPNQSRTIPAQGNDNEDLLGDTDANVSSKLTNETAELGNMSNQIGSLSREMTDLQGKRSQADQEISQNTQQKKTFEARLAQLRSAFDTEVKEFKALQERLTGSRNETKRLQQDIAMIEGSHADTKSQHEKLRAAYDADQQENASLKERMRQVNLENDQLKPQIEKFKSDARQQKGLVAINKKQLATNELERERIQSEIAVAQKEVEDAKREIEETTRQIEVSKKELGEAHQKVAAKKKELEETSARAAASKKELEEVKAIPRPSMPVPTVIAAPIATAPESAPPAPVAAVAAGTTRELSLASPPLASPTPSTVSNPFMRRDGSTFFSPPMGSPEPTHDHSAFDSIFGPSFGPAQSAAPVTSFGNEAPATPTMHHEVNSEREIDTPTSSTVPDVVEPPAPPSGQQITSSALPLRSNLERTESMTSSVKVMAPASRLSPADTPRAITPGVSTPGTDRHTSDLFGAAPDEEQESVRQSLPRMDTNETAAEIPGAFPSATPRSETPVSGINPTTIAVGAGAAALAAGAGLAAAATSQTDQRPSEPRGDSPAAGASAPKANNFDEYFGGPAHQRTASEQVKDFDDAFASMNSAPVRTNGTTKASDKEFPDIQEVDDRDDDDDDSSAYSEETPLGFDDDFNARSSGTVPPTQTAAGSAAATSSVAAGKQPEIASALPGHLQVRPPLGTTPSTASSLPGIESQASPPTYGDSVPENNPTNFPREFKGLLPEREDPTSPPLPTAGGATHPGPNPSGSPPAYGPEMARTQQEALAKTQSSSAAQPPAFDFDSAFAGMGPAQVHEDDSDEEEQTLGSHRNQMPEFDPTFGSPAQSRAATVASITQSPRTTTHDAVTNGAPSNPGTTSSSFFGFGNNGAFPAPPTQTAAGNPPAVSHDWDALFAPLSSPPATDSAPLARVETQHTEISPEINARTSAAEVSGTSTPIPSGAVSTAPIPQAFLKPQRPQPGRALSTGTEHDDPILKQLTSMGWSRNESLAALEKYDYNIDKAMDYLTFRS